MQPIFIRFLLSNLALALFLSAILLMKRLLRASLSPAIAHGISRFSLILLILPGVPYHGSLNAGLLAGFLGQVRLPGGSAAGVAPAGGSTVRASDWMQDYVVSAAAGPLPAALFLVWLAGAAVLVILAIRSACRARRLGKSAIPPDDPELLRCFSACRELAEYKGCARLGYSPDIASPMVTGLLRPMILLPLTKQRISGPEMQGILLHELYHLKHHDTAVNGAACLLRALYWFNPAVWLFLRELRTEAEIHCDAAVLRSIGTARNAEYGRTVLSFALKKELPPWVSAQMGSGRERIKRRILSIASCREETRRSKRRGIFAALLLCLPVAATLPCLSVFAAERVELPAGAHVEDLSAHFNGREGAFVLYDGMNRQFTVYNEQESTRRSSPASTCKIYSLLFALDAGVIDERDSLQPWDGTEYGYESWQQDHDLYSAIESSVNWYFQQLDEAVGAARLQRYYARIGYGNMDLSGGIREYWQGSSLKISLLEQVCLLQQLYGGELDFAPEDIQTVRRAISLESRDGVELSGKTGTLDYGAYSEGCFVGRVKTTENEWFFAVSVSGENVMSSEAAAIALSILAEKGIG